MKKRSNRIDINIGGLIQKIGPINNEIRQNEGYRKISLMWDLGDILLKEGVKKVHPIAWEIQRKSYITRDLVSYCYRIRKKWPDKTKLHKLFRNVKLYSTFREALPLIENEKFILSNNEVEKIIESFNKKDPRIVKKEIIAMKKRYIDIKNDRRQRLSEVKEETESFRKFYQYLVAMIQKQDKTESDTIRKRVGDKTLLEISQICMAIASDSYKGPATVDSKKLHPPFKEFTEKMLSLSLSDKEKKARFRRLIPPEKIVEIADIMNSLRLGESPSNILRRLKMNFGR